MVRILQLQLLMSFMLSFLVNPSLAKFPMERQVAFIEATASEHEQSRQRHCYGVFIGDNGQLGLMVSSILDSIGRAPITDRGEISYFKGFRKPELVSCCSFFFDQDLIAVGTSDGRIELWEILSLKPHVIEYGKGEYKNQLVERGESIEQVLFCGPYETNFLLALDGSGKATLWRTADWEFVETLPQFFSSGFTRIAVSDSCDFIAAVSAARPVYVWAVGPLGLSRLISSFSPGPSRISALAISCDGLVVATGEYIGVVRLWNTISGHQAGNSLLLDKGNVVEIEFLEINGQLIMYVLYSDTIFTVNASEHMKTVDIFQNN